MESVAAYPVEVLDRISAVDASEWDACAGTDNPFTRHAHLNALETSGSVCPATGFEPSHLVLRDPSGRVAAAAPAYVKSHSEGELGPDLGWSMAHERFCGPYYPKLQVEVPLTPYSGPRLLVRKGAAADTTIDALRKRLLMELIALATRLELSSVHVSYMTRDERDLAIGVGMLPDRGTRFVWKNENYGDFDGYLASLRGACAKKIRRERRAVLTGGSKLEWLTHHDLSPAHSEIVFKFYTGTYRKYGVKAHLTRAYFDEIFRRMPEDILLVLARRENDYVGGTLFFLSRETVFSLYWGCLEDLKFLHFETTYYQSIDYALANGQRFIDSGASGRHKVTRGLLPADVHHAHWFRNQDFSELIAGGLEKKSRNIDKEQTALRAGSPFKRAGGVGA